MTGRREWQHPPEKKKKTKKFLKKKKKKKNQVPVPPPPPQKKAKQDKIISLNHKNTKMAKMKPLFFIPTNPFSTTVTLLTAY